LNENLPEQKGQGTVQFEPGSYLEIVPWDELQMITCPEEFSTLLHSTGIQSYPVIWMEWNLDQVYERHIFTEEEVFQYHLQRNSVSVGHLVSGKVVFGLIPLEDIDFLSDMRTFWEFWVYKS
jgi:hypothetical protein